MICLLSISPARSYLPLPYTHATHPIHIDSQSHHVFWLWSPTLECVWLLRHMTLTNECEWMWIWYDKLGFTGREGETQASDGEKESQGRWGGGGFGLFLWLGRGAKVRASLHSGLEAVLFEIPASVPLHAGLSRRVTQVVALRRDKQGEAPTSPSTFRCQRWGHPL